LSPILFIIFPETMSREFGGGLSSELLHAEDRKLLIADSVEEIMDKYTVWKESVEGRGPKVNTGKTKVLVSGEGEESVGKMGRWPCALCEKKVQVTIQYCVNPAISGCTRGVKVSGVDCRWFLTSNELDAHVNKWLHLEQKG